MKHQRHFESSTASRQPAQTRLFIADLDRIVQILNNDICMEEEQAGIFDRFHPEYPMLARALAARREGPTQLLAQIKTCVVLSNLSSIRRPLCASPCRRNSERELQIRSQISGFEIAHIFCKLCRNCNL